MALGPLYIADKSALARAHHPEVSEFLSPLIMRGQVATCGIIELELLYSARSYRDLLAIRAENSHAYPRVPIVQSDFDRAIDVMEELARRGAHRAVGMPDLIIAAVAERAGLTIIHYDSDYDTVAGVTGQPTMWVAPRGSIP